MVHQGAVACHAILQHAASGLAGFSDLVSVGCYHAGAYPNEKGDVANGCTGEDCLHQWELCAGEPSCDTDQGPGFIYGDAAFDVARTFQGRPFRLREHLDRLYASCRYLRLDPGMGQDEMQELTLEVLRQNLPLLGENEDYWVTQRVTRGVETPEGDVPTVLIECRPLPLAATGAVLPDGGADGDAVGATDSAAVFESESEDAQLPEHGDGGLGGAGAEPGGLGVAAG